MSKTVLILNGGRRDATLAALNTAKKKAKDTASKRIIRRLAAGLKANPSPPAARSRAPHSKEEPVAKKQHARRATHRRKTHHKTHRKTRRNPTAAPKVVTFRSGSTKRRRSVSARARSAFSGLQRKTGVNFKQVALLGVGIAAGALLNSFVEKQTENYLPDLNPYARVGVVTLTLGVGGYFVGKYLQRDVGTGIMAGAIGEAIRSVGRNLAPGLFSGTDAPPSGYPWNEAPVPIADLDRTFTPMPLPPVGWRRQAIGNVRRYARPAWLRPQLGDLIVGPNDVQPTPQVF